MAMMQSERCAQINRLYPTASSPFVRSVHAHRNDHRLRCNPVESIYIAPHLVPIGSTVDGSTFKWPCHRPLSAASFLAAATPASSSSRPATSRRMACMVTSGSCGPLGLAPSAIHQCVCSISLTPYPSNVIFWMIAAMRMGGFACTQHAEGGAYGCANVTSLPNLQT